MKTIVVKIKGKWQLIKVEAGRIFTGEDHNMKAIKYFDKKVKENAAFPYSDIELWMKQASEITRKENEKENNDN